jgi:hypothetical protein
LAERKLRLPALSGSDESAIREFTSVAFRQRDADTGRKHGLEFAEEFHYIGPDTSLDQYITRNAVPL